MSWFTAFALTIGVELVVAVPLLVPSGASGMRRASVVGLANLATHPLVWFVFPALRLTAPGRLVAAELFALFVEAATYFVVWPAMGRKRAFATSALANGASLAVGLSLRALGFGV